MYLPYGLIKWALRKAPGAVMGPAPAFRCEQTLGRVVLGDGPEDESELSYLAAAPEYCCHHWLSSFETSMGP